MADALRGLLSDVNWARAGLGLPLLEERREKIPSFSVPSGPRPPPEGQSMTSNSPLKDGYDENVYQQFFAMLEISFNFFIQVGHNHPKQFKQRCRFGSLVIFHISPVIAQKFDY